MMKNRRLISNRKGVFIFYSKISGDFLFWYTQKFYTKFSIICSILLLSLMACEKEPDVDKNHDLSRVSSSELFHVEKCDFGFVPKNKNKVKSVRILNKSEGSVRITGVRLPEGFTCTDVSGSVIIGNRSIDIEVDFAPKEKSDYSAKIIFITDFKVDIVIDVLGTSDMRSKMKESTLNRGLVASYTFDGSVSDDSGNRNHASLHGASETSNRSGEDNNAFRFDGIDDFISVDNIDINEKDIYALSLWTKFHNTNRQQVLFSMRRSGVLGEYSALVVKDSFLHYSINGKEWVTGGIKIEPNVYYNIVFIHDSDGGSFQLFINGDSEYASSAPSFGNGAYKLKFGTGIISDSYFSGIIDEIRIYNRALTEDEISIMFTKSTDSESVLSVFGESLYGFVGVTASVSKEIVIVNSSQYTIGITKVDYPHGYSGTIFGNIPPNGSETFTVNFSPNAIRQYNGNIYINTDTDDVCKFPVNATSVYTKEFNRIFVSNADFGFVAPGLVKVQTLSLINLFKFSLNIEKIIYPEGFSGNTSNLVLNSQYVISLDLKFSPSIAKVYNNEIILVTKQGYRILVNVKAKSLGLPSVTTSSISDVNFTTAVCGGDVFNRGDSDVTARGVVWSTSKSPTLETNSGKTINGIGKGVFTGDITGLLHNTKYYVRAYATNSEGSAYGEQKSFTTPDYSIPVLMTSSVTSVSYNTAKCGGDISSDGFKDVTARGVVWSTYQSPTIESNTGKTSNGTGVGVFTSDITVLSPNTTYYVRAYATNSKGTAYGLEKIFTTKQLVMEMVTVSGGTFQMGSASGDSGEKPVHSVTLSSFEIGKYEVTQTQWKAVMDDANPSQLKGDNRPVEKVSWDDVQTFITKLNQQTGKTYRLPTEAEWEFAARGGVAASSTIYAGSNTLGDVAWYSSNSDNKTHEVGGKQANELGIYDMSGNVWEWCNDWYSSSYYSNSPIDNPQGPTSGPFRVRRGGSWSSDTNYCRVNYRNNYSPYNGDGYIGFRLARSL